MTTPTITSCPSWCTISHTVEDEGCHSFSVLSERFAGVGVEQEECLDGIARVRIFVDVAGDTTMTVEEAVRVAAAITEAVQLAGVTR